MGLEDEGDGDLERPPAVPAIGLEAPVRLVADSPLRNDTEANYVGFRELRQTVIRLDANGDLAAKIEAYLEFDEVPIGWYRKGQVMLGGLGRDGDGASVLGLDLREARDHEDAQDDCDDGELDRDFCGPVHGFFLSAKNVFLSSYQLLIISRHGEGEGRSASACPCPLIFAVGC